MKTLIAALFAILSFVLTASGQTLTGSLFSFDGTKWNAMSKVSSDAVLVKTVKLYYIEGISHGRDAQLIQSSTAVIPQNRELIFDMIPHLAGEQVVDALDRFYADYKNVNVPVVLALPIIAREVAGVSKADIEKMTETARKISVEIPSMKNPEDFTKICQEIINNNKTGQVPPK